MYMEMDYVNQIQIHILLNAGMDIWNTLTVQLQV